MRDAAAVLEPIKDDVIVIGAVAVQSGRRARRAAHAQTPRTVTVTAPESL
jgi:hypothetical protein